MDFRAGIETISLKNIFSNIFYILSFVWHIATKAENCKCFIRFCPFLRAHKNVYTFCRNRKYTVSLHLYG